jgi:NitT/TauT family transport system substrate-binding protein
MKQKGETMRRTVLAATALAVAWIAPAASEPLKLRISWATTPSQITPMLPEIPHEAYRHWGKSYVVEPVFMQGNGVILPALQVGELEIAGYSYQSYALSVFAAKLDVKAIASVFASKPGYADSGYWVKKSRIRSYEDLRGKNIAVNSRGSTADASLHKMLADHGLKDQRDYQIVEVRFPAMLPTLESDKVAMAFLVLPFSLRAGQNPDYKQMFSLTDALGPNETVIYAAKSEFIAAHRAALVDFLEDNIRARAWLYDPKNRDAAIKMIAKVTKQPEENFRDWILTNKDNYRSPDAAFDPKLLQKNVDDLKTLGVTQETFDVSKHVDLSLIAEAKKRLGR